MKLTERYLPLGLAALRLAAMATSIKEIVDRECRIYECVDRISNSSDQTSQSESKTGPAELAVACLDRLSPALLPLESSLRL